MSLKKLLSLLLISIIALSAIGNVEAKSYNFDCNYELGDTFTSWDVMEKANKEGFCSQGIDNVNNYINESGLFTVIGEYYHFKPPSEGPWKYYEYRADIIGEYTRKVEWGWPYDPDYFHFSVKPHGAKLVFPDFPYIDTYHDYKIIGKVNICATDPDKSKPEDNEFWNSDLSIDCVNLYDENDAYHVDVNTGANNYFDFHTIDWHLRKDSTYNFTVKLINKGDWSGYSIQKYLESTIPDPC